jgi:hypothetical protein
MSDMKKLMENWRGYEKEVLSEQRTKNSENQILVEMIPDQTMWTVQELPAATAGQSAAFDKVLGAVEGIRDIAVDVGAALKTGWNPPHAPGQTPSRKFGYMIAKSDPMRAVYEKQIEDANKHWEKTGEDPDQWILDQHRGMIRSVDEIQDMLDAKWSHVLFDPARPADWAYAALMTFSGILAFVPADGPFGEMATSTAAGYFKAGTIASRAANTMSAFKRHDKIMKTFQTLQAAKAGGMAEKSTKWANRIQLADTVVLFAQMFNDKRIAEASGAAWEENLSRKNLEEGADLVAEMVKENEEFQNTVAEIKAAAEDAGVDTTDTTDTTDSESSELPWFLPEPVAEPAAEKLPPIPFSPDAEVDEFGNVGYEDSILFAPTTQAQETTTTDIEPTEINKIEPTKTDDELLKLNQLKENKMDNKNTNMKLIMEGWRLFEQEVAIAADEEELDAFLDSMFTEDLDLLQEGNWLRALSRIGGTTTEAATKTVDDVITVGGAKGAFNSVENIAPEVYEAASRLTPAQVKAGPQTAAEVEIHIAYSTMAGVPRTFLDDAIQVIPSSVHGIDRAPFHLDLALAQEFLAAQRTIRKGLEPNAAGVAGRSIDDVEDALIKNEKYFMALQDRAQRARFVVPVDASDALKSLKLADDMNPLSGGSWGGYFARPDVAPSLTNPIFPRNVTSMPTPKRPPIKKIVKDYFDERWAPNPSRTHSVANWKNALYGKNKGIFWGGVAKYIIKRFLPATLIYSAGAANQTSKDEIAAGEASVKAIQKAIVGTDLPTIKTNQERDVSNDKDEDIGVILPKSDGNKLDLERQVATELAQELAAMADKAAKSLDIEVEQEDPPPKSKDVSDDGQ